MTEEILLLTWIKIKSLDDIHEKCEGCDNNKGTYCIRYHFPGAQWTRVGGCAMASHISKGKQEVFKLNPLKASKRRVKQS